MPFSPLRAHARVGLVVSVCALALISVSFFASRQHAGGSSRQIPVSARMQLSRHTSETSRKLEEKLGRLPLRFEAVARRQDSRVRFVGRAHGYGIILTERGAAFTLRSKSLISRQTHSRQSEEWRNFEVLEMTLKNAHRHPKIQGVDETSGTSNYFRGKTGWRTDVKSFAKVRYEQIYDGVDLVFYGNPQQLEYDFIVAPGADPQAIKLRFNTKDRLRIDGPGSLVLKKNDVELTLQAPRAYQDVQGTRRQVECQFRLSPSGEIAFKLGPYDQSVALTIDPVFSYSTYLGGTGFSSQSDEIVNGVAVDAAGNAYVVGTTISTDFPVQNAYKSTGGGFTDAFVSKINPSGTALVYSTYLGGDRNDEGLAIAVEASGAAYVTGVSASTNFPTTPGAFQTQGLDTDVFVTKLSPAGNALVYSTLLNGERRSLPGGINLASSEDGRAIAVDSQGQACVVGETQSGNFPRANEFQTSPAGGFDAFVTKLNATGTGLLFSTYLGGSNTDRANGVALDGAGNIYLTGEVYSTDFPTTPGSLKPTRTASGNSIGFVTRFSNTGAMIYSTYLGDVTEAARGIAVDSSGNAFVTGETSPNSIFPTTPNAIKPARDLGAVYRSNSAGGSWQGSGLSHDVAVNGVAVDPANSAKLYAGTQAGLFRSIDTGGAWSLLGLPGIQVLCVAVDPNNPLIIFAGTNGQGIFRSIDGGSNWTNPVAAGVVRTLAFHPQTSSKIYAGGFQSSDGGTNWVAFGSVGGIRAIAFAPDPNTIYIAGNSSIAKTTDGGANWTTVLTVGDFFTGVAVEPNNPSIVYASHRSFGFHRSTNAGQSWTQINTTSSNEVLSLTIDRTTNPATLYAGTVSSGVIKSANGGTSWQLTGLQYSSVNSLAVDRRSPNVIYAGSSLFSADAFLSELNANGSALLYSTYLGGGGSDTAYGIALDAAGNPVVAGRSSSVDFPLVNALQQLQGSAPDAFVSKFDLSNPALSFSSMVGGTNAEDCRGVAVDSTGNIYLAGVTRSTDFPSLTGIQPTLKNIYDGFVSKLGTGGSPASIQLSSTGYSVSESAGVLTVTVLRSGDTSQPAAVDYATDEAGAPANCSSSNGFASARCDFTTAAGTLKFAAGETQKTINILVSRDTYNEGAETFSIILSNASGVGVLSNPSKATITVNDGAGSLPANAIDDPRTFVGEHYHDFLNRQADPAGWDFWTNQITSCGNDAQCTEVRRIDVSASFFLSIEFQQTGYLVERFYKVSYGDTTGPSTFPSAHQLPVPIVRFNEFLRDTQRISQGVIVLQPGWEQLLESNKQAYALEFVQTSRFVAGFPLSMGVDQFVDRLNQNSGNALSASERMVVINLFGGAVNSSNNSARAQAVRKVAEDADLYNAEYNRAFVLAQYFGYLRRDANATPDTDYTGYDFWLTKLNQFNGNYINAEMVKAFLSSIEYRQRFGP